MAAEEKHYHENTQENSLPKIGTSIIGTNTWNICASYFWKIREEIACIKMKQAIVIRELLRIRKFHYIKKNIAKIRCLKAVNNILNTKEN